MTLTHREEFANFQSFHRSIKNNPYNPEAYLSRANWFEAQGFPDLAAGDAYKALLLSDEIRDASGEYHQEALNTVESLATHLHKGTNPTFLNGVTNNDNKHDNQEYIEHENSGQFPNEIAEAFADRVAFQSYRLLASTLSQCGCLKSANDFTRRGLKAFPNARSLSKEQACIREQGHKPHEFSSTSGLERPEQAKLPHPPKTGEFAFHPPNALPEQGTVRRVIYPWNDHEPDRHSESALHELNKCLKEIAPKCEVRAVSLPLLKTKSSSTDKSLGETADGYLTIGQLGLFATEDISPNETVLCERSVLAANNRLHDPLCDACSGPLPTNPASALVSSCDDCEDTIFCSPTCASLARELYHPAVCGRSDFDMLAKDPSPHEASSALYLALLGRTFAMAETQAVHPLDLPETKYLWGDFTSLLPKTSSETRRYLPFTFQANILSPLNILERMDINIFTSPLAETWVVNTLYAKFRGTASARFNTTGIARGPEVAAVHPMWCLANHSCAPNVKWDWSAEIRFTARGGKDIVHWGSRAEQDDRRGVYPISQERGCKNKRDGGIQTGEEILNHYCDTDLPVKERREWAVGALGGDCMCERCQWEEEQAL